MDANERQLSKTMTLLHHVALAVMLLRHSFAAKTLDFNDDYHNSTPELNWARVGDSRPVSEVKDLTVCFSVAFNIIYDHDILDSKGAIL